MNRTNIAVFASGSGTNCENIIRYFKDSELARVALVVSNKPDAPVLEKSRRLGVDTAVISRDDLHSADVMLPLLRRYDTALIVLAGFLPLVPDYLVDEYSRRIINIHPSLLPKFGGKGMWGHHVHEAVKAARETETGMTVHWVTPVCDGGEIIAQFRTALTPDDSADDIARKEHELEMKHFPQVIEQVITSL